MILRAADTVYLYRFLTLLVQRWEETSAYKAGIIDKNGNALKRVADLSSEELESYTPFHRLVFNIKRLIPGNKQTRWTSFAAALYLLREKLNLDLEDFLTEAQINFEFETLFENAELTSTSAKAKIPLLLQTESLDKYSQAGDKITNLTFVESIDGVDIYKGCHEISGQWVFASRNDLISLGIGEDVGPANVTGNIATVSMSLFTVDRKNFEEYKKKKNPLKIKDSVFVVKCKESGETLEMNIKNETQID